MSKAPQFRRSFGTIHMGHLPERFSSLEEYFHNLNPDNEVHDWADYTAGAFALEEGSVTQRKHIQFYVEHKRKRPATLASDFYLSTGAVFDSVRDAKGSWDYCTGSGAHRDKPALDRFQFGTPKLHGDTQRADLKMLVNLAMDGIQPEELVIAYPYAWAVHRQRMICFYRDWERVQRGHGLDMGP